MMATDRTDTSLPFIAKKGLDARNNSDGDTSLDDINNFLSMSLPSLSANNSVIVDEYNNEFLHLTAMARFVVRAVYLSYLHKCLLSNYITCYKQNDEHIPNVEVKRCADQMELNAVRLALEVSLYRQNMLRMIADVKSHTTKKKAYKKLAMSLEAPKDKVNVTVQTEDIRMDLYGRDKIQSLHVTSNLEEALQTSPTVDSIDEFCNNEDIVQDFNNEMDIQISHKERNTEERFNNASPRTELETDHQIMDDATSIIKNEDENSRDSLLQHMEDMFCESDDSSDLTKLIEKHCGVTKANIDKEISEICLKADTMSSSNLCIISQTNSMSKSNAANVNTSDGKVSFSRYKEMRNREMKSESKEINEIEIIQTKQKQRRNAVWFVERVHQESKLKAKMTELSLTNYRKHGRVKEKFLQLFGESDEEEMMPDSPICIEEYLPACKERIAPWIVKYLMPFYKNRRIKGRQLFKAVAKYIADMLIIENTFPEQGCVSKYIDGYFKNKRLIQTKQDIYL